MVLCKLVERDRRPVKQAGNCVRDGCRGAAGEIGQQATHDADVPLGHSRFAHSIGRRGEWYVHVLNCPSERE